MFTQLAEELRNARERAQYTQESLAGAIRMDIGFLQRLEKGDLTFLPELYVKAFIKDYARTVGLDETQIIRQYENAKAGRALNDKVELEALHAHEQKQEETTAYTAPPRVFIDGASPFEPEEKSGFQFTDAQKKVFLFGGLFIALLALLGYFLFIKDDTPKVILENQPIEDILAEQQRYEEPPPEEQAAKLDSLELRVEVKDSCWVAMTTDSLLTSSRRYAPGAVVRQKAASNIKLTLGNASKVLLFISGQSYDLTQFRFHTTRLFITRDSVQVLE